MTHDTDCRVLDEHREKVNALAEILYDDDTPPGKSREEAREFAEEHGWEAIGGGIGRYVFRVAPENQEGPVEKPTHEAPCVIKFATVGQGNADGALQNRFEIEQFGRFPKAISDPDEGPPIVVPISDYDDEDHLWISMPEVDPAGGSAEEAQRRMAEQGWKCSDVHSSNVGVMHGKSLILDYGLECESAETGMQMIDELKTNLEGIGVDTDAAEIEESPIGLRLDFQGPDWVTETGPPPEKSMISVIPARGVDGMRLYFGLFDDEPGAFTPDLDAVLDRVAVDIEENWFGAMVEPMLAGSRHAEYTLELDITNHAGENWAPDIAADLYSDVCDAVHEHAPGGEIHELPEGAEIDDVIVPDEGDVLDHPDFDGNVTVLEVDEHGNIMVEDEDGLEYNLRLVDYEDPRESMLVDQDSPDAEPEPDIDPDDISENDLHYSHDYGLVRVVREPHQVHDFEGQPWMVDIDQGEFVDSARVDTLTPLDEYDVEEVDITAAVERGIELYFLIPENYDGDGIGKVLGHPEEDILYETQQGEEYWIGPEKVAENLIAGLPGPWHGGGTTSPEDVQEAVTTAIDDTVTDEQTRKDVQEAIEDEIDNILP